MVEKQLDGQQILDMTAGFSPACVIGAAAELDVFAALIERPMTVEQLAEHLGSDLRATTMLLDAVAALGVLKKEGDVYSVPGEAADALSNDSDRTIVPMILHRMNILRAWAQLAWVTKAGIPGPKQSSIRGPAADRAAFVAAMHSISGPVADDLVARIDPPAFTHLLDVGGASGTWTMALLRAMPDATATIFDLPDAVNQARQRIGRSEFADRVSFAPGDFYADDLPKGADFAWVSAIAHQHGRPQNRALFEKVHAALSPGGRIGIRDVVMEPCHTQPSEGAMFAINMLVNTDTGGTFTLDEFTEDLEAAGFADVELVVKDQFMNSVIMAVKAASD